MKKTTATTFGALALLVTFGVPASAQNREHLQLMADLRMLQEQTQQLAINISTLNEAVNAALKTINTRLEDVNAIQRKGFADQKLVIDGMGADLRVIRERVDDTNVRISTLGQEIEALRTSIPVAPPVSVAPYDPADPNAPPLPLPSPVQPSPSTAGLSPTRMYETAFADYAAGQWSLAITGFEAFLKTFPRSEMADDAQFYIGETYYAQSRFSDAIAAYNQVIQSYPATNSVPLAYYKRGLSQERLGQTDAARASYEFTVTTYPDSDAGRLAKQSLDRLGRPPASASPPPAR
jgi:tol-pal system protein YbgF